MKKTLLLIFTLILCFNAFTQQRKFEVVCEVYNGKINYAGIDKILPDSLQKVFIKMDKKTRHEDLAIVNILGMNGWSLLESKQIYSSVSYLLKYEFTISEADYPYLMKR